MEKELYGILRKHKLPLKKREEMMVDLLNLFGVCNWVACDERLPDNLQTVWLINKEKQWVALGCLVEFDEGWHWAETNGTMYIENNKIVSECESDDLDVTHWCALPEPPCY